MKANGKKFNGGAYETGLHTKGRNGSFNGNTFFPLLSLIVKVLHIKELGSRPPLSLIARRSYILTSVDWLGVLGMRLNANGCGIHLATLPVEDLGGCGVMLVQASKQDSQRHGTPFHHPDQPTITRVPLDVTNIN
jgi:hypothetical protein